MALPARRAKKLAKKSSTKTTRTRKKSSRRKTSPGDEQRAVPDVLLRQSRDKILHEIWDNIWPVERKTLFNPDRIRYVRKLIKPKGCVFCQAVKKGIGFESLLLFKGKHAIVVLNKYPYNNGHLLVLPKRHEGGFLELTQDEHNEIGFCLRRSIKALKKAYQPKGFNVGLNLGAAAGAGIPEHLHYHVIPRWSGDTNFFALIAETKVVVETLEQTFDRLLPYFE